MAIAYESAGPRLVAPSSTSDWSVGLPDGVGEGDLLVLHVVTNGGSIWDPPADWLEVYRETGLSNPKGGVFVKVAGAAEPATVEFSTTSTNGNAIVLRYSGVDPVSPLDVAAVSVSSSVAGFEIQLPSISTVRAEALLVYEPSSLREEAGAYPAGTGVQQVWQLWPGSADEPDVVYAGTQPSALFRSEDGGESWEFISRNPISTTDPTTGLPNSGFSDPEFALDTAGNVYISEINLANIAISKSTDSGRRNSVYSGTTTLVAMPPGACTPAISSLLQ